MKARKKVFSKNYHFIHTTNEWVGRWMKQNNDKSVFKKVYAQTKIILNYWTWFNNQNNYKVLTDCFCVYFITIESNAFDFLTKGESPASFLKMFNANSILMLQKNCIFFASRVFNKTLFSSRVVIIDEVKKLISFVFGSTKC